MKILLLSLLLLSGGSCFSQLFNNKENMALVNRGVDFIYNMEPEKAEAIIDSINRRLPSHPIVPLMRSSLLLWSTIPYVTVDSTFLRFTSYLDEVIRLASRIDGGRQEDPEAVFFETVARGLLAEYYADAGAYVKAINEASKAYTLLKTGSKLTEEIPEFYLTTGVYNYFREKYPEKYPVYKPFLFFFRNGDISLGLAQLEKACEVGVLTKVEAYIYLSYIYLRYEYEPTKAVKYLKQLLVMYPNNRYVKAKYLESLASTGNFSLAPLSLIEDLKKESTPYFEMAGHAFFGLYQELVEKDVIGAKKSYLLALSFEEKRLNQGDFYIGLSHLALARIYQSEYQYDLAKKHGHLALEFAETPEIAQEAKALIASLGG